MKRIALAVAMLCFSACNGGVVIEEVVGTEGAELRTPDGRLELDVPTGAVGTATRIVVRGTTARDPRMVPGAVFEFEPTGLRFSSPASLRLRLPEEALAAGVDPGAIGLAYVLPDDSLEDIRGSALDPHFAVVQGQVDHFSVIGAYLRLVPGEPDGGTQACTSSDQCPNQGVAVCTGDLRDYWTCGNDGYCLHWVVDCAAAGQVCNSGACGPRACQFSSDCLNGGVPYCDGNVRRHSTCDFGSCVPFATDCGATGKTCTSGACLRPDAGLPDGGIQACFGSNQCPNQGVPVCAGDLRDYWTCGNDGSCLHWLVDCAATGRTCQYGYCQTIQDAGVDAGAPDSGAADAGTPDAGCGPDAGGPDGGAEDAGAPDAGGSPDAATPCTLSNQCLNGGEPYCDGQISWLWLCTGGQCVPSVTDCADAGRSCISGSCQP
ncbi:MAG: hypothetical protein HYZ28_01225 [Myxococcales bacterium]|nr:hypothetical protein [Myxococcales bacterium]